MVRCLGHCPLLRLCDFVARVVGHILSDSAEHVGLELGGGLAVGDLSGVQREHVAASPLDTVDDLGLDLHRADQPVEEGHHDHVRSAFFDRLHGLAKPRTLLQGPCAGNVQLLVVLHQLQALALTGVTDAFELSLR